MSIFTVMTKAMIVAIPDEYCGLGFSYATSGDMVIVTHPKHPPIAWNKQDHEWKKIKLTGRKRI